MDIESFGRTLVVAPHPDDEVLGAGGTIARLSKLGTEVFVAVVTTGRPPAFSPENVARVQAEAKRAHAYLGVSETFWLDQPAGELFETSHVALNAAIDAVVRRVAPTTMILPFVGDIHLDHQLTFLSSLVAVRPHQPVFPRRILAYETLSETNWNAPYISAGFWPNVFVEIEQSLSRKLEAMRMFESQVRGTPHERSLEAIEALAVLRGATVHSSAAEGFVLVRHVI